MSKNRMIDRMNSLAINISKSKIISTISQGMMTLFPGSPQALPSSPGRGFTFVNPPEPADLGKMAQM